MLRVVEDGTETSGQTYFYIQTLDPDCGVKGQTAAEAVLEEVLYLSCLPLQNILDAENK